jgi:hypothetical protein
MKNIFRIIVSLLFVALPLSNTVAQSLEIPQAVISGFNSGSAEQIASYLSDNVDLTILNNGDTYTKQQTKVILADFFRKNSVRDFELAHNSSKENMIFGVGNLTTTNGDFRVYFSMRKSGNQLLIYLLRIEN